MTTTIIRYDTVETSWDLKIEVETLFFLPSFLFLWAEWKLSGKNEMNNNLSFVMLLFPSVCFSSRPCRCRSANFPPFRITLWCLSAENLWKQNYLFRSFWLASFALKFISLLPLLLCFRHTKKHEWRKNAINKLIIKFSCFSISHSIYQQKHEEESGSYKTISTRWISKLISSIQYLERFRIDSPSYLTSKAKDLEANEKWLRLQNLRDLLNVFY